MRVVHRAHALFYTRVSKKLRLFTKQPAKIIRSAVRSQAPEKCKQQGRLLGREWEQEEDGAGRAAASSKRQCLQKWSRHSARLHL